MTKWMCGLVAFMALVFVPQASAAYTSVGSFADQAPDGDFVHQQRIAINRATEKLYVADTVGDRVRVFAAASTASVEGTPFGAGALTDPFGVAVDQQTGDVYVSDDDDVVKFNSSGVLDPTFISPGVTGALAFDQVADELLVADGSVVRRYSPAGAAGATFNGSNGSTAFAGLQDIAVDSTGDVLLVDSTGDPALGTGASRVERFSAAGAYETTFGPVYGAATVTVEPGSDRVIVSGNQDAIGRAGFATIDIFDPATPGTPVQSPISTSQFSTIRGMAVDGANRLYASSDLGIFPSAPAIYGNINIQAFEVVPEVVVGASTGVTAEAATLHGTVNPNGGAINTAYRFEISSDDGASWTPIDPDGDGDEDAGSGTAAVAVSETVTGLMPSTSYRVRLVAVRGAATITSAEATFTTGDLAPAVADVRGAAASSSIRVSAKIHPNRLATTYVVQYGLTTAYGRSFPVTPATVDPGSDPVYVTKTIAGLTPSTSYHLRVVATNSGGVTASPDKQVTTTAALQPEPDVTDTCPNAAERATQGSGFLPECRAYEQVSPVQKNDGDVSVSGSLRARFDGDAALMGSTTALPDAAGRPAFNFYRSLRTSEAWTSRSVDPPIYNKANLTYSKTTFEYSRDMRRFVVGSRRVLAPGAVEGDGNIYRYDIDANSYELIATASDAGPFNTFFHQFTGANGSGIVTDDAMDHVVLQTATPLTDDAAPGVINVYEWSVDGGLRVVNRLPDGTVNPSGGSFGSDSNTPSPYIMNRDGTRLFLQMDGALYSSTGSGPAKLLSASRRAGEDPAQPLAGKFLAASADGTYVFFEASAPLLDTVDQASMYRLNTKTSELIDIPGSVDPITGVGGQVRVLDVNYAGDRMYFTSFARLRPGLLPLRYNLYTWHDGQVDLIFALDYPESDGNASYDPGIRASANGRFVAISTGLALTDYDSTDQPSCQDTANGATPRVCREVYVYDAETQAIACASCDPSGTSNGSSYPFTLFGQEFFIYSDVTTVLDDGRVFFDSPNALNPRDINGKPDVYEWHDGRPYLISSGTGDIEARLADVSPDGTNVMFTTRQRLVGQDEDEARDLYTARVGGGLRSQDAAAVRPRCDGDACQPPGEAPGGAGQVGTAGRSAGGDAPAAARARFKVTMTAAQRRSLARTGRGVLSVTVSRGGRIDVVATARVKRSRRTVASGRVVARVARRLSVPLRLSAAGRAELRRVGRLSVSVTARFSGVRAAKPLTIALATTAKTNRSTSR